MNRLDVETSKLQPMAAVVAGVVMVPIALLSLASGVMRGFAPMPLVMGVLMLAMYGALVALVRWGGRKSIRYLTEEGMERGDGRWLPWTDLERVVRKIRVKPGTNTKAIWRTEIWFKNGESAWLLPLRARNFEEVNELVGTLPCEHTEKRA